MTSHLVFFALVGCDADDLDLHSNSNFIFISDRQKGILPAITKLFPCAEHIYCLRHIHENMKSQFKGKLYKDKLWKCASATTIPEFTTTMDELKAFNKKATCGCQRAVSDMLLNNMCEVYNAKIVEGRDKPIISALEYIREYLMRRIVTVLNVIDKSEGLLTPWAAEQFEKIKKEATFYYVQWNGGEFYEVSGKPNHARVVNLEKRTCSCMRYAVAALWEMGATGGRVGALESWVHPVYTMERWMLVYSHKINPINGRTMRATVQCPITITPPKHHTQVGRPRRQGRGQPLK
ncbi:uncharacterized protein LOC110907299 [Helianthus annuus]|uniref:uncharacterized protein LOC110907299 n=1 Tax=Helianthus annuus TaxID=4232 RepID=UPI000B8F8061|nr:uncharacterized protein LOC110907299 [Helianthus annuus]